MKLSKIAFGILFLLTISGCASTIPLNQQFYNTKKVGVILQVDSIRVARAGSQGLLDMAMTPGFRFMEPLKNVEQKLKLNEIMKNEISALLQSKNKTYELIIDSFDYQSLEKFDKPKSKKKYCKKDFRKYKLSNQVDEIMYVKVNYGLLVSYYGFIETGKQGFTNIETEIVDLSDNSLLQREYVQMVANIKGHWKKGEEFENLKNAIQESIDTSISKLKSYF